MQPRRMLRVSTTFNPGSAENHLLDLVGRQVASVMDVTVAYFKGDDRELGVPTHSLGCGSTGGCGRWGTCRNSSPRRIFIGHAHRRPSELYVRLALLVSGGVNLTLIYDPRQRRALCADPRPTLARALGASPHGACHSHFRSRNAVRGWGARPRCAENPDDLLWHRRRAFRPPGCTGCATRNSGGISARNASAESTKISRSKPCIGKSTTCMGLARRARCNARCHASCSCRHRNVMHPPPMRLLLVVPNIVTYLGFCASCALAGGWRGGAYRLFHGGALGR